MQYKHFQDRPGEMTADFVRTEYRALIDRIEAAENSDSADLWIELFADWNALKSFIGSEGSRRSHALSKDMNNEENEKRDEVFRSEIAPVYEEGEAKLVESLLASKHRDAIAERYGHQLLKGFSTMKEPLAAVNSDLRVKERDLSNTYSKLIAGAEVEIDGKTMTLPEAGSLLSSSDEEDRKKAYIARSEWFLENRDEIAAIFDEMVKLRTEMGRNLGHDTFIPLGYNGMGRTDYNVEEAKQFRENVRRFAVPLLEKIYASQAGEHGTETLEPWNMGYTPSLSLPRGVAPIDAQLDNAERVFDKISPTLADHFRRMRQENLIDLENRRGKRAGAYCTSFSDEGRVAILCNSTGDEDDVRTLMHEMGHAFQGWESQPIEAVDLQWPTSDACEVHSMGMEYLAMKHIDEFFTPEQATKFSQGRWRQAVSLLCYICVVDEFQHWIYENPDATPDERDAAWAEIDGRYRVGIDYSEHPQFRSLRWYAQGHIFWMPFYYIDYAIAETGAMQLGLMDREDPEKALSTYLDLCRIGGQKSVLEIFDSAGLRNPFDEGLMSELMEHARKEVA